MHEASLIGAEIVCFGETFLQGFDSLSWNYITDKKIAITKNSQITKRIAKRASDLKIAVGFGYIEKERENLFSSYLTIDKNGEIVDNYQRVSPGWKEISKTDHHYREGTELHAFVLNGYKILVALCGDLWDEKNIKTIRTIRPEIILWPAYVNFSIEKWKQEEKEYALQASKTNSGVLMVNSISRNPDSLGGCCFFYKGQTIGKINFGTEGILEIEI
jgi:N-carbamoylputrescine amidase